MAKPLSEQVAELERELSDTASSRDIAFRERNQLRSELIAMRGSRDAMENRAEAAESRLAQARVEGARTALAMLEVHFWGKPVTLQAIAEWRERAYPATGEEPTRYADVVGCDGKCCARPAPPAVTEPPRSCRWCGDPRGDEEYGVCSECVAIIRDCVTKAFALASRPTASGEG